MDPILLGWIAGGSSALVFLALLGWRRARAQAKEEGPTLDGAGEPGDVLDEAPDETENAIWRGLARTRSQFGAALGALFGGSLDDALFEGLEEALISADVGIRVSRELTDALRERARSEGMQTAEELRVALSETLKALLGAKDTQLLPGPSQGPGDVPITLRPKQLACSRWPWR